MGSQLLPDGYGEGQGDLQNLYQREEPHTLIMPLATHTEPDNLNYKVPSEAGVEAMVCRICPHRAGGHTHLRAEHFKQW